MKVIKWLDDVIEKRVEVILDGKYRKSYYKVALLVVAYAEIMFYHNLGDKELYIRDYQKKYYRRLTLKQEIQKLL